MNNTNYRNGNGVLDMALRAHGRAAESIRNAIRWNEIRERSAVKAGRHADAARHAGNRATAQLQLVKLAQEQEG